MNIMFAMGSVVPSASVWFVHPVLDQQSGVDESGWEEDLRRRRDPLFGHAARPRALVGRVQGAQLDLDPLRRFVGRGQGVRRRRAFCPILSRGRGMAVTVTFLHPSFV